MNLRTRIALLVFSVVLTTTCAVVVANYLVTQRELYNEVDDFLEFRGEQIAGITDIFTLIAEKLEPGFEYWHEDSEVELQPDSRKPYIKVLDKSEIAKPEKGAFGEPLYPENLVDQNYPPYWDSDLPEWDSGFDAPSALILSPFTAFPLGFDAVVQIIDEMAKPVLGSYLTLPVETADHHVAYTQTVGAAPLARGYPVEKADQHVAYTSRESVHRTVLVDDREFRMLTAPLPDGGAVQVARDLDEINGALRDLLLLSIFIGAAVALFSGTGAWMLARRVTKPVRQLTDAAEQVAATQDLTTPIEIERKDEVGRLGRSFNAMLEALRLSRQQQRRLVADAGHELRTPLTSIRANVDLMMRSGSLPATEQEQILSDMSEELKHLSKSVGELLELAGGDGVGVDEPSSEASLEALANAAVEKAARRTDRAISVEAVTSESLTCRPEALGRAIDNLIGNALKFSPDDSPVRVVVDGRRLVVHDQGQGIPDEDLPRVFDRFYRSVAAQSQPGSGLGLAIVKQIVELHDGHVWVKNAADGGAEVGFELGGGS